MLCRSYPVCVRCSYTTIPSASNVSFLKDLIFLHLSDNRFTGELPSQLLTLRNIQIVAAVANRLCGSLYLTQFV
jgi:hypothetical protein